jgi:hypothetical protein
MWPRSQSVSWAKSAGLPALQSVLKRRLAGTAAHLKHSGGSSSKQSQRSRRAFRKVSKHVVAALQACVDKLQAELQALNAPVPQQPVVPRYGYYPTTNPQQQRAAAALSASQNVLSVLQQGLKAAAMKVKGATDALVRLVGVVAATPAVLNSTGTATSAGAAANIATGTDLAEQLAKAALKLDAAAVGQPLQQLMTSSMRPSPASCIALVKGLAAAPELQQQVASAAVAALGSAADTVEPLLSLAGSLSGVPAIQKEVVSRLVSLMQQDTSGAVADQVAALLPMVAQQPQLLQPLVTAAAASLIATGPVQHWKSVTLLLQACKKQEQLQETQQQLVGAMCASLRSGTAGAYQASSITGMLSTLDAHPSLQQQLLLALADGKFSNPALLATQTDASMLQLCPLLLSSSELKERHFPAYAAAVATHPRRIGLLVKLASPELPEAALQQLVESAILFVRAAGVPGNISGAGLQVADWARVIAALQHAPVLQQQLRRAVVVTVCMSAAAGPDRRQYACLVESVAGR